MRTSENKKTLWAGRRWILIAAGLLVCHASLMITAVVVASSGNTFVAMPEYYKKSLDWDVTKAAVGNARSMGLRLLAEPGETTRGGAGRLVKMSVVSDATEALPPTKMRVKYFHHANAGSVQAVTLSSGGSVEVDRPGFWQFEISGEIHGQSVRLEETVFVGN